MYNYGSEEGTVINFQFSIFDFKKKAKVSVFKRRGFTLIEILIDLVVFTLVAMAVLTAYMASLKSINSAKIRIAAVSLANEKMEMLRNMPYDSLATQHGVIYPAGGILDYETVERNGTQLIVHTVIGYVDDPYDNKADSSTKDLYPYDYKKAEVTIKRSGINTDYAKISSLIAAKAAETTSNTGIVKLCVVDSQGIFLPDANVIIRNMTTDPPVDIQTITGADGCIMVPKLPPDSHNNYHLEVSKDGYSQDMTYPRTSQNPNALQPDVNVILQQITLQTLSIDVLGSMKITVKDELGNLLPNTTVHIEGAKEKWFNPSTKKYSEDKITDANGIIELPEMEFDDYSFSAEGWTVASTSPYQLTKLLAGANLQVVLTLTHDGALPQVTKVDPISGMNADDAFSLTVTGNNFQDGLIIKIIDKNGLESLGQNVLVSSHAQIGTIDATFNLTALAKGMADILIVNTDGKSIRQFAGFEIK